MRCPLCVSSKPGLLWKRNSTYIYDLTSMCADDHFYIFRRRLCALFAQMRTTILRKAELLEKRNALCCRIIKWREVQTVYMPGAEQIIARAKSTTSTEQLDHAEHEKL